MRSIFISAVQTVFISYFRVFNRLRTMSTADVVILTFAAVIKLNMLCMTDYLNTEN